MELNEMVQSMLLKISNQESDWKKSLKHLRKDLNTKVSLCWEPLLPDKLPWSLAASKSEC